MGTLGTSEGQPAMSIHIGTEVCNHTKPFSRLRNVCIARTDQEQVIVEFSGMVINKLCGVADSLRKGFGKRMDAVLYLQRLSLKTKVNSLEINNPAVNNSECPRLSRRNML